MTAEILGQAVEAVRADHEGGTVREEVAWLAVADWLERARDRHLASYIGSHAETQAALTVARAYLGEVQP